ncbi:Os04g0435475 [Oryza sativa Japonica Group]|uniref:Os04g0435475 protein n=1 Tax=Oryza sativa subsp. japonica TaxID=39947 RepID=A0A0P0WAQ0_ORYSJ|nr:hypothetical protein EE612_023439 [Oryza sativa]KAF2934085.1 hypothetical protein DAI22_04g135800 [Oryza sativa Japonica Group]BAS89302.1 Os04g0435475 [Oryza sativa Japonica Group]
MPLFALLHYIVYKYLGAGDLEQLSLLVSEFQDKSEPGRGRKREPKSSGNGNMEESLKTKFLPPAMEVEIWFGFFPMPPIPIVLKHFFLFLSARTITLMEKLEHIFWIA